MSSSVRNILVVDISRDIIGRYLGLFFHVIFFPAVHCILCTRDGPWYLEVKCTGFDYGISYHLGGLLFFTWKRLFHFLVFFL